MRSYLLLIPLGCAALLSGCAILKTPQPEVAEDGSRIYTLTSLYQGTGESGGQMTEWMDNDARNLCRSDYTLLSEESIPIIDPVGAATSSRLVWKIKCRQTGDEPRS